MIPRLQKTLIASACILLTAVAQVAEASSSRVAQDAVGLNMMNRRNPSAAGEPAAALTEAQLKRIESNGTNGTLAVLSLLLALLLAVFVVHGKDSESGNTHTNVRKSKNLSVEELEAVVKLAHAGKPEYNKDGTLRNVVGESWTPAQTMAYERQVEEVEQEIEEEGVSKGRRKYAALFMSS
ncbi:hypothetical protein BDR26DRAFT_882029 [Obelidium mucronatum]|nr:hypothetical protein BDR26DRAFT_882029 [Obelidium mucronatum]